MVLSPCLAKFQRKSSSSLRLIDRLANQENAAFFMGSNEYSSHTTPVRGRPVVLFIVGRDYDSIPSSLGSLILIKLTEDGHWSPGKGGKTIWYW